MYLFEYKKRKSYSVPLRTLLFVQIAAAFTACARIYMYPFTSRDYCYYTDTDSVVLSNPLPSEFVDSNELGKFQLECMVKEAIF